jgi:hypothetical protein
MMPTVFIAGASHGSVTGTVRDIDVAPRLAAAAPERNVHFAEMTDLASIERLTTAMAGRPTGLLICNAIRSRPSAASAQAGRHRPGESLPVDRGWC